MLFRTEVLKKLGGFDPRYFLYFEDYDLSLRTHEVARVAYVPSVRVLHHGGDAARKGWTHIKHVRRVGVQVLQPLRLEVAMSDVSRHRRERFRRSRALPCFAAQGNRNGSRAAAGGCERGVHEWVDNSRDFSDVDGNWPQDFTPDCVVHLAARVHMMRDDAADPRGLPGNQRRRRAAGRKKRMRHGARRFVFVSSIKAVAEATPAGH